MERRQCKGKGRSVGCCGCAGEETAGKEMWQIETWTERPRAGLMVLAGQTSLKGKYQMGQRAGKGREYKGNERKYKGNGSLLFFNDYPCIVSPCKQRCQGGNATLFQCLLVQFGMLRLLKPGQEKLN